MVHAKLVPEGGIEPPTNPDFVGAALPILRLKKRQCLDWILPTFEALLNRCRCFPGGKRSNGEYLQVSPQAFGGVGLPVAVLFQPALHIGGHPDVMPTTGSSEDIYHVHSEIGARGRD
jgi:hypothetical protein